MLQSNYKIKVTKKATTFFILFYLVYISMSGYNNITKKYSFLRRIPMSLNYPEEFNILVEKAKAYGKPVRVAVAAADCENILKGVFAAQEEGFVYPILVGNEEKINKVLDAIGMRDRKYSVHVCHGGDNPVQYAIEMINSGDADVLMRGNTQTRDYLLPILNKMNHLVDPGKLVTHVTFLKVPDLNRVIGVSDVTLLINPTMDEKIEVLRNMTEAMKVLDINKPNIALLSMVEKPSFQMRDTVEDQTIVKNHLARPYADCNLAGPIAYDLIISKEAARLKGYDCPYCGEFDGIVAPNLMAGNLLVKVLEHNAGAKGFGVVVGAKVPIAIASRSDAPHDTFLSLAACVARMAMEK